MGTSKIEYTPSHPINHQHVSYLRTWFKLMRPMTFSGTISPILTGTALASLNGPIRIDLFIVLFIASICVQISANLFNDYFDFKHGQDQEKWMVYEGNDRAPLHKHIPFVAIGFITAGVILGAWISMQTSWWIAVIGSISILGGILYSAGNHSLSALGLGEITAATFLGFVTTILGYIVQGHSLDLQIISVALTFALLISTMILTNNIRDIKKDVGFRNTVAMRLGKKKAVLLLTTILMSLYIWVFILVMNNIVPPTGLLAFFAMFVAARLRWSFRKDASRADEISAMGWAGEHHYTFGLLFALGISLGIF